MAGVIKKALDPKEIEDAMRDVPERNARIMASTPGERYGYFYKLVLLPFYYSHGSAQKSPRKPRVTAKIA